MGAFAWIMAIALGLLGLWFGRYDHGFRHGYQAGFSDAARMCREQFGLEHAGSAGEGDATGTDQQAETPAEKPEV